MENRDVWMLDADESRLLDHSFRPGLTEKRMRNIAINFVLVLAALALFAAYGIGMFWLAGVAAMILIVSAAEKVSYAREMMHYKALVRKLVHRVEQLEGSSSTVLGSYPAARAERQRELDQPREPASRHA